MVFNIDYRYDSVTGIGRYGLEFMKAWISDGNECELWVQPWMARQWELPEPFRDRYRKYPVKMRFTKYFWPSLMAIANKVEWVHSANCVLLPSSRFFRQVCMVHDMGPVMYGQMKSPADRKVWRKRLENVAAKADCILVNSLSTMKDLIGIYPETEGRIHPTPLGIDHMSEWKTSADRKGLHLLAVGTVEPRKNYDGLIRAYEALNQRRDLPPLIIAGGSGYRAEEYIRMPHELGIANKVRFTGFIKDVELARLYSEAICLVHPAHHEGFGFTVPEAFRWDIPVVASNTGGLAEFFSSSAWMVDPESMESIAAGIEKALDSGTTPEQRESRISLQNRLTWKNCVRQTRMALEGV